MRKKVSYEELKQRVKALEKQTLELKRVEEAMHGTEQEYRDLYENALIAYLSVRADDGSILRVNSDKIQLCHDYNNSTDNPNCARFRFARR